MSELIDRIPGRESALAGIRNVVDTTLQFKARQRLTGRSGQLGYAVASAADWDYEGSVPFNTSSYESAKFHIIFTSDGTQRFPIVIPRLDVRINGTATSNRIRFVYADSQYKYEDSTVNMQVFAYGTPVPAYFASETQSAWLLELFYIGKTGSGNLPVRIKARAQASSGGTFSVVRVA